MKKNKAIKCLSFLTATAIVISTLLFSFNVFAEQSGDYTYEIIDSQTCRITGYTGTNTKLVIPSEIDGYTVTQIGDSAFETEDEDPIKIEEVTIPESVTYIGYTAFFGTAITEIVIPEGVEVIEQQAFDACPNLVTATLPSSVSTLGMSVFGFQDPNLQEINISSNNQNYCSVDGVVFSKDMTKLIQYPIGKTASSYSIPDTVSTVGEFSFMECTNLKNVYLPKSVTTIEDFAFCNTGLQSVVIPENIQNIGSWAFANNYLATITILSKSDFEIGEGTFDDGRNKNFQTFIGYADSGTEKMVNEWLELAETDDSIEINYKFVPIEPANLQDKATNIIVSADSEDTIPYGTSLKVTIEEQSSTSVTYNITLISNGNEIQPNGTVSVKIPVPENLDSSTCKVYRIESNGSKTDMNAVYKNGYMEFSTDHFSKYVLSGEENTIENPDENSKPQQSITDDKTETPTNSNDDTTINTISNGDKISPNTGADGQNYSLYALVAASISGLCVLTTMLKKKFCC